MPEKIDTPRPTRARIKDRAHELLWAAHGEDAVGHVFSHALICLIILNVLAVILESVEQSRRFETALYCFEVFSVGVFSIEYFLRLWACTSDPRYARPILGRLRYALTFLALVDLIAVVPFYLPLAVTVDLRVVRALRLIRLLRVMKLAHYSESVQLLGRVLKRSRDEIMVTIFVTALLVLVAASVIYVAEHDAQPDKFSSIPASMWWAVVTLTTVGYGDVYPITTAGKIMAACLAFLGIGMFALPTGIISSGFMEEVRSRKQQTNTNARVCPHCGKNIEVCSGKEWPAFVPADGRNQQSPAERVE